MKENLSKLKKNLWSKIKKKKEKKEKDINRIKKESQKKKIVTFLKNVTFSFFIFSVF